MGLALQVPHLICAIFQTLTLNDEENGTSHYLGLNSAIHQHVFHAHFGFGEVLAWVSLLGFAPGEWAFSVFYPDYDFYSSIEGKLEIQVKLS